MKTQERLQRRFPDVRPAHRGVVLVVVVVCFVLAAALFVALVQAVVREHKGAEIQAWNLQAQWLAEAGLERAAARLAANPSYSGETWTISAAELAGKRGGVVRISVKSPGSLRLVQVQADFPDDPVHRCRATKEIEVNVKKLKIGDMP